MNRSSVRFRPLAPVLSLQKQAVTDKTTACFFVSGENSTAARESKPPLSPFTHFLRTAKNGRGESPQTPRPNLNPQNKMRGFSLNAGRSPKRAKKVGGRFTLKSGRPPEKEGAEGEKNAEAVCSPPLPTPLKCSQSAFQADLRRFSRFFSDRFAAFCRWRLAFFTDVM